MNTHFFILMKAELSLGLILFLLLILKLTDRSGSSKQILGIANVLLLLNFALGFFFNKEGSLFSGMYNTNSAIVLEKNILNAGLLLISFMAYDWIKTHPHLTEFYLLMISTVMGLFYMISSGTFLMFYLGLELASIPLAALVNFDLEKRKSSEAAMKLILNSAFASGFFLFGISLLYGASGTLSFSELFASGEVSAFQLCALVFIFSGFAFKLSAVPFHFWTADVYEGAPVPVTAFLSVLSKAATAFVFISVLIPLFHAVPKLYYTLLLITIVFTILIGNLFAIRQTNIKRFLAFSSIAQVGYIFYGLSSGAVSGISSAVFFLIVYLFSNLAAFAVIGLVSVQSGKENIEDYKGFYKNNPFLSWVLGIALFSLAGIPPTAGFFGKLFLLTSGTSGGNYGLLAFAALNMVVSLYYYLRLIRAVFIDQSDEALPALRVNPWLRAALLICLGGMLFSGLSDHLPDYIQSAFNF
ncbi:MAG TPA: NADH-quinone oxidoreductase subunit N [Bacteroidia bacterium]|nr:NADH-quinone oxidoreductase subunit N [Bacteroidia bacterium]